MTKELKLKILKGLSFLCNCSLSFEILCTKRVQRYSTRDRKRREKLLFIKKCFLQLSKEIKKKGWIEKKENVSKGVANGSQEGK